MKKRTLVGILLVGTILSGVIGGNDSQPQSSSIDVSSDPEAASSITEEIVEKKKPICDGTTVTAHCTVDGVHYTTYIYHPAVAEKSHTETVTTYREEITGYCTLCNDGTYSPSCATGRGACSHHGGVAQWNAPRYSKVPEYSSKTVIDVPAQEAYYERVAE